jgi:hypothetical protein
VRNQCKRIEVLESKTTEAIPLFVVWNAERETEEEAIKRRYPDGVPPHSQITFIHTNVTRRLD